MVSEAREVGIQPPASAPTACARPNREDFLGAVHIDGLTRFRVWAPDARRVDVRLEHPEVATFPLERAEDGYFVGEFGGVAARSLYKYSLDGQSPWPDPCSRFQPNGPHGPSAVGDPASFNWQD